jgi:hypothetical protein
VAVKTTDNDLAEFGPLAPFVAGVRDAIDAAAEQLGPPCPCEKCDGYGWVPSAGDVCYCPVCVGEGWVGSFGDHPPVVPIEERPL